MIKIVDYGIGNIAAFLSLFKKLGIPAERASTPEELRKASKIILPGVGSFDHAMQRLNQSGLRPFIEENTLSYKKPILGVCVGMQMLAEKSDEGSMAGLNLIPGRVRSFKENAILNSHPIPHMGWNTINPVADSKVFDAELSKQEQFYFLHSYYFDATDKQHVIATCEYGIKFDAVVAKDNIYGIQCHPEKSHEWGERFLKRFYEFA